MRAREMACKKRRGDEGKEGKEISIKIDSYITDDYIPSASVFCSWVFNENFGRKCLEFSKPFNIILEFLLFPS